MCFILKLKLVFVDRKKEIRTYYFELRKKKETPDCKCLLYILIL